MKNPNQANGKARKNHAVEPAQNTEDFLYGIRVMPSATLAFLKKHSLKSRELILVVLTHPQVNALWDAKTESSGDRKRFFRLIGDKTLKRIYREIWRAGLTASLYLSLTRRSESYLQIAVPAGGPAKRVESDLRAVPVRRWTGA